MPTKISMLRGMKTPEGPEWVDFFRTYYRWLLHHASSDLRHPEDREDVCQEVLRKVAKAMPTFIYDPKRGSFRGWLLTILRNEIINFLKKKRTAGGAGGGSNGSDEGQTRRTSRTSRVTRDPVDKWPNDLGTMALREVIDLTFSQLQAEFGSEAAEMFRQRELEGESSGAIASRSRKTLNAVYTRNSRIRGRFRELFKKNLNA